MSKTPRAAVQIALAALGLLALGILVWKTGWTEIWANILRIGPWFLVLVAINLVGQAGFVLGLRTVLEPRPAGLTFPHLYRLYLMGDAANYVVPGGGEAAKTHFLRKLGGGAAAVAAITLHKHADLVAQCTFAILGVGAALAFIPFPRHVAFAALAGILLLLVVLLLVTRALARGAFSPILRRLARWKFLESRLEKLHASAESVDARIAAFHASHPKRFLAAAAFCFLGYCGGLVETWIVLRLLAPAAAWPSWLAIETLPMVLNNFVLFIPGKLGGAEGIRTGVFVLIGLSASQGAAYAILRRARELVWVIPGWVLLVRERMRGASRKMVTALSEGAADA